MGRPKKKGNFKDIIKSKLNNIEVAPLLKKEKKSAIKPQIISEEDEAKELAAQFKTTQRRYPLSETDYTVFLYIPSDKRISKSTEVGSRVIVATYPFFYKIYFIEYVEKGIKFFPNGGIKCYNSTFEQLQYFPYDSVAIHPTKKDKYRVSTLQE